MISLIEVVVAAWIVGAIVDRVSRYAKGWVWFSFVQGVMGIATLVGLVLLIWPCRSCAWILDAKSNKDGRPIDRWKWRPLNCVYGNPEDGVSGQQAKIWNEAGELVGFQPDSDPARRAYNWSAKRNSCDQLKYLFAWSAGPDAKEITILGRIRKFGWQQENGVKVPVLS